MRIYIASPMGFSEGGKYFYNAKFVPMFQRVGHEVLDPWTLTDESLILSAIKSPYGAVRRERWREVNEVIGRNNVEAINRADLVVAVLDGADVDSGTASEVGFAFARDKRIIGYRNDFRLASDNEGSIVNLQVEYFIHASGGPIVKDLIELERVLKAMSG